MRERIERGLNDHLTVLHAVNNDTVLLDRIAEAAARLTEVILDGGTIYLCGNGGSAADCQHFAAELVGRFKRERSVGFAAVALTTDTSALTAIANDYGYAQVFERQLRALATEGDALICYSTSGNSPNVVNAARWAVDNDVYVLGLTGLQGGTLGAHVHTLVDVPSADTARVQEMHSVFTHLLCECVEEEVYGA